MAEAKLDKGSAEAEEGDAADEDPSSMPMNPQGVSPHAESTLTGQKPTKTSSVSDNELPSSSKSFDPPSDTAAGTKPKITAEATDSEATDSEDESSVDPFDKKESSSDYSATPEDIAIKDGHGEASEAAREAETKLEQRGTTSLLFRLADGIGSLTYARHPTGSRLLDRDFRERLVTQDIGVLVLLLGVFAMTMCASCFSIYYLSADPSPARFYCNVTQRHRLLCESDDTQEFLTTFNTQPQSVRLRLIGRHILPRDWQAVTRSLTRRMGFVRRRYLHVSDPEIAFDVSLDMTPFLSSDGRVTGDELATLQKFIADQNPLEVLVLQKRVEWVGWEDVATNARQRLRTLGFEGKTEVVFEAEEELVVIRNHPLSNFARSGAAKALICLSVIGGFFWWPYIWAKSTRVYVKTSFQISVEPERYWELLGHGLNSMEGFHAD